MTRIIITKWKSILQRRNLKKYLRRYKSMVGVAKSSPYREALISLINSINKVIPLKEENQVLLVMQLNSEEKIIKFNEWIKSKLKGENELQTTETEIVRAAVQINKGNL